jgi:hypothetical protein
MIIIQGIVRYGGGIMKGWRSTNWMEILDPKEVNKEPIPFYRRQKQGTHVTVNGRGKVAVLKQKRGKK